MASHASYTFSSESVGEGHPDKVADSISDSVLDACFAQDRFSRVACETLVKSDHVVIAGELTTKAKVNFEEVVRAAIREIGYVNDDDVFHADKVFITNLLTKQSPDIAQGVDERKAEGKKHAKMGAGDQGIMFGYASTETPELMPAPVMLAHRLNRELARLPQVRRQGYRVAPPRLQVPGRRPLRRRPPGRRRDVVISTQHTDDVSHRQIEKFCIEQVIRKVLPKELVGKQTEYLINPTGRFVVGGPEGDCGLTGRRSSSIRTEAWAATAAAPSRARIRPRSTVPRPTWPAGSPSTSSRPAPPNAASSRSAYAIGHPEPTSIHLDTFGTGEIADAKILEAVKKTFLFNPAEIIRQLDLRRPIYRASTHYGHFGKKGLPWRSLRRCPPSSRP
jgi:S-adenosylmethionine synthetase